MGNAKTRTDWSEVERGMKYARQSPELSEQATLAEMYAAGGASLDDLVQGGSTEEFHKGYDLAILLSRGAAPAGGPDQ
jgi:acyl CoA:acetate/3-ketoacid CoA transferase alpha subunit